MYIIHAQLGFTHVMRAGLNAGEALSFWAPTAGRAMLEE